MVGFIFLVFGTLVYNEIIILPILGFDKYTRVAFEKKESSKAALIEHAQETADHEYLAISPHAGYDATRNKRALEKIDERSHGTGDINKTEISAEEHEFR